MDQNSRTQNPQPYIVLNQITDRRETKIPKKPTGTSKQNSKSKND